jgi:hypothetical protein
MNGRFAQLEREPLAQAFLTRNIVFGNQRIGAIGFHAKSGFAGRLEVDYEIFWVFKRQGFALEAVTGLVPSQTNFNLCLCLKCQTRILSCNLVCVA